MRMALDVSGAGGIFGLERIQYPRARAVVNAFV
jgi:hypothetical protein